MAHRIMEAQTDVDPGGTGDGQKGDANRQGEIERIMRDEHGDRLTHHREPAKPDQRIDAQVADPLLDLNIRKIDHDFPCRPDEG